MSVEVSKKWLIVVGLVAILVSAAVVLSQNDWVIKDYIRASVIERFNKIHFDSLVWDRSTWMGVPTAQNPCDMWVMQEIICEIKPDYIIETGTYCGGSCLFFASLLSQVNPNGKIITVDIKPQIQKASQWKVFRDHVEVITGDSVSPEVINKITERVKGGTVLVALDSLHLKDHVLKELKLYSKFVSRNSYLIVQDTNLNGHPVEPGYGPGPMEAIQEFLKDNHDFEIDREMERQMLTYFPSGFLRRVR